MQRIYELKYPGDVRIENFPNFISAYNRMRRWGSLRGRPYGGYYLITSFDEEAKKVLNMWEFLWEHGRLQDAISTHKLDVIRASRS